MNRNILITAGATYLDIDAYACMVAMAELRNLQGKNAVAYSSAPCNYSVCNFLIEEGQIVRDMPTELQAKNANYVIVDVSDPDFLQGSIPLESVIEVYDHHMGFADYWQSRIGAGTHIEFIGAAATLIYREWEKANMQKKMACNTAKLLIAAILDNTLNLTSSNTTPEDIAVFRALCKHAEVGEEFRAMYFTQVQNSVEADLKNALFGDIKKIANSSVLPSYMGQVSVWNVDLILEKLEEISSWFSALGESWMLNVIDIQHNCNYFVCKSEEYQRKIEQVFQVRFEKGTAKTSVSYLRKEIIKKMCFESNF